MNYGFVKAAVLAPRLRVADCAYNTAEAIQALAQADREGVLLACLPELSLTGCTCGDLFRQRPLLEGALHGLEALCEASKHWNLIAFVGLPLLVNGKLYDCAAAISGGELLGLVPCTHLGGGLHCFAPAPAGVTTLQLLGQDVPFGTRLLFRCSQLPQLVIAAQLGRDLSAPLSPSAAHALAGATVLVHLGSDCEQAGGPEARRQLVVSQSARLLCGCLSAQPGRGESTTDLVFGGHGLIAESGTLLAQRAPFTEAPCITDLDVERLTAERLRNDSFVPCTDGYQVVDFGLSPDAGQLTRAVPASPFIPQDPEEADRRCELILTMQADGLAKRMVHAHAKTAVIGISGGLDSCLALLVALRTMEQLGRPASDIHAVSMPCFGTSSRTRSNAQILCEALHVGYQEIRIADTVRSHFADIGHDGTTLDVTFENAQARVRTLELMDLANRTGGLVVGTGDLSELALGWATYNGDHMSMYGVNADVPKTLVQQLVRYAAKCSPDPVLKQVLTDILDTPVSPELLPAKDDQISQRTQDLVGPYELHDFFLYYILRYGFGPGKVFYLAKAAFAGRYPDETILHWMKNFYRRFFMQQFKRSCLPDGPKVGSVSLSPRGDWQMPSDASAALWQQELEALA